MNRVYNGTVCYGIVDNITVSYDTQVNIDELIVEDLVSYPDWVEWHCQKSLRILSCFDSYASLDICQESCDQILEACDDFIDNSVNYYGYNFSYPNCSSYPQSDCASILSEENYPTSIEYDSPSCPPLLKLTNRGNRVLIEGSQCGLRCPAYGYSEEEFDSMTDTIRLCCLVNIICFLLTLIWLLYMKLVNRDPITNKPTSQIETSRRVNVRESEFIVGLSIASLAINLSAVSVLFSPQSDLFCNETQAPYDPDVILQDTDLSPSECSYQGFLLFYFTTFSSVWLACQSLHMLLIFQTRYDATTLNKLKIIYRLLPICLPLILTSILADLGHFGIDINLPFPYCNYYYSSHESNLYYLFSLPNLLFVLAFVIMLVFILITVSTSLSAYYKLQTNGLCACCGDNKDSNLTPLMISPETLSDKYSNIIRANLRLLLLVCIFGVLSFIGLLWQVIYWSSGVGTMYDDSRKDFESCLLQLNQNCGQHPEMRVSPETDEMLFIISTLYGISLLLAFGPGVVCLSSFFRFCCFHSHYPTADATQKTNLNHNLVPDRGDSSNGTFTPLMASSSDNDKFSSTEYT